MNSCSTGHHSTAAKHDNRMIKSTKIQRNTRREKCKDNRPWRILPLFHFSVSQKFCHVWSSPLQEFSCLSISPYHCHATYSFCWWQICFSRESKHQNVSGKLSYRKKTSSNLRRHFNVKGYHVILSIQLWVQLILMSVFHSNPHFFKRSCSLSGSGSVINRSTEWCLQGIALFQNWPFLFCLCLLSGVTHSISHKAFKW